MGICEKHMLMFVELMVTKEEGEHIIEYHALILPCCIERGGSFKIHFSIFIPVTERLAYCIDTLKKFSLHHEVQ